MKIEFSKEEADVLISLLDVAVKATGLQAAEPALNITKKLYNAFESNNIQNSQIEVTD